MDDDDEDVEVEDQFTEHTKNSVVFATKEDDENVEHVKVMPK